MPPDALSESSYPEVRSMKKQKWNHEQIGTLCRALGHLYHAGIGVGDALALLAEDEAAAEEKQQLLSMSRRADEGVPLARIFRDAGCFPDYVCNLTQVGERVGRTEDTLKALADYYEGRARMECRVKNALLYPSVLLVVLLAVVVILLVWVLPVFNDVYARLGSSLTGLAGGLLMLGGVLRKIMPLLCVLLALAVVFAILMAVSPAARDRLLGAWRKGRGDKGVTRQINTARFAQALSMGMTSGLTDREAVELAANLAQGSEAFQHRCAACLDRLDQGVGLSAALRESELLSKAECRLLEAGIKGGNREQVMEQIALRALEESEQELENLTGRIEPTVVVVLSVLVGAILLSVMLPLMHIMTAIG